MPTSSAAGIGKAEALPRICCSTPGAILQPQPPPCENCVRRIGGRSGAFIGGREKLRVDVYVDRRAKGHSNVASRRRSGGRACRLLQKSRLVSSGCICGAFLALPAGVASCGGNG